MSLPAGVTTGLVTGTFNTLVAGASVPVDGMLVVFTPSSPVVLDAGATQTLGITAVTGVVRQGILYDASGAVGVTLIATDSAGITPTGFTWLVQFQGPVPLGLNSFSFALPGGTTKDLATISPVPPVPGVPSMVVTDAVVGGYVATPGGVTRGALDARYAPLTGSTTYETQAHASSTYQTQAAFDTAVAAKVSGASSTQTALDRRYGFRIFTPEAYGAQSVPGSIVDDTTAVQAAMTAAAGIGVVRLSTIYGLSLSGVSPNKQALVIQPGTVVEGIGFAFSGFKLLDGQGSYHALLAPTTLATNVGTVAFRNFQINANTTNNPVANSADLNTNPRLLIAISAAANVTCYKVQVLDHTGTNTFYLSGTALVRVEVSDCQFLSMGTMPAANGHDSSTIYVGATADVIITRNVFDAASDLAAHAAIEIHGGRTIVTGNEVNGYLIFANITGIQAGPGDNVVVTGNTGTDLMIAMVFYSGNALGGSAPGLRNVTVRDNNFTLNRDLHLPNANYTAVRYPAGFILDTGSNLHLEDIDISGNHVYCKPYSLPANLDEAVAAGLSWWRTAASDGPDQNLRVTGNTFVNMPGPGVRISTSVTGLRVRDNRSVDPGGTNSASTAATWKCGVILTAGTFKDAEVASNTTYDSRATHLITGGVDVSTVAAVTNGRVLDNTTYCADGTILAGFAPSSTAGTAFFLRHTMPTWQGLFQPVLAGSEVRAENTGDIYYQTATPSGSTFMRIKAGRISSGDLAAATTLGAVTGKIAVFDSSGTIINGYLPVYGTIT